MAQLIEKNLSRKQRLNSRKELVYCELSYLATGCETDEEVRALIDTDAPDTYADVLARSGDISIDEIGGGFWDVTIPYSIEAYDMEVEEGGGFSFRTGGGSQHITHSLRTVSSTNATGDHGPNFQQAINVERKNGAMEIGGTDIGAPQGEFSETYKFPAGAVTSSYRRAVIEATYKVNSTAFREWDAGEVLFLGADGSREEGGDWTITFNFAASPNRTDIAIGDINVPAKKGWEYLWVLYEDNEDTEAKRLGKKAVCAYVEQVYEETNLAGVLGI